MLIAARNGFAVGKRLPYDAEVEYLESTGTQWIDTGMFGNLHTRIEIVIEKINNSNHYAVCGFFLSGSSAQITVPANTDNTNGLYARFGNKYISAGMGIPLGKHTLKSDRDGLTIDGVSRGTFGATADFTTPGSLAIFRFKGLDRNFFVSRMLSCRFYDGGVLVRDFIPVRFTNEQGVSEGAMYDKVTKRLFRNRGTGAFVIGPDKSAANV